jgi:hypothetical protein
MEVTGNLDNQIIGGRGKVHKSAYNKLTETVRATDALEFLYKGNQRTECWHEKEGELQEGFSKRGEIMACL